MAGNLNDRVDLIYPCPSHTERKDPKFKCEDHVSVIEIDGIRSGQAFQPKIGAGHHHGRSYVRGVQGA